MCVCGGGRAGGSRSCSYGGGWGGGKGITVVVKVAVIVTLRRDRRLQYGIKPPQCMGIEICMSSVVEAGRNLVMATI